MKSGCGHETDELYLHSRCHTNAPTWVRMSEQEGYAVVECSVCDKEIITLRLKQYTHEEEP
jgi:hypothetical protein